MISTFWAFAGLTSVHNIYLRFLHTFVLTDLLLVAMLAAVAITPLGLLKRGDGQALLPRLGPRVLSGAGTGAGAGAAT